MCQMCDDPNLTPADLRAQMFSIIEQRGWMIQYVEAEPGHEAFAYTVGLTALNLPELYVAGLGPGHSAQLLNAAATEISDGDLGPSETFDAPDGRRYLASSRWDVSELLGALEAFGTRTTALELRPL
ncbi:MAG: DUF4262 domain-containing protein [Candidatus Nanopelagicales bacterium]|nr:DUF4262 domain-containing protein [Candidatus Nanopelagicales bacterium]